MLIIGIAGTELEARERDWLQHPSVEIGRASCRERV